MGDIVKKLLVPCCALLAAAGIGAPAARADTVWTIRNAQFGYWVDAAGNALGTQNLGDDRGMLNGSFTLDNQGNVTSFDFTSTASANTANLADAAFAGWTYNNATATVTGMSAAGDPLTRLAFTTNPVGPDGLRETLSLVFVSNLLSGKSMRSGLSLLCTTANAADDIACNDTPSGEFLASGNQDGTNLAFNDPYRALSPPAVDPPACDGYACVTGIVLPVPEPATLPLLLSALVGLGFVLHRRPA